MIDIMKAIWKALILAGMIPLLGTPGRGEGAPAGLWLTTTFPRHLLRDAREAFWGQHLAALSAIGGSFAGLARLEDRDFQSQVLRHRYIGESEKIGSFLGQPYSQFGYVGLTYGLGRLFGQPPWVETSELMLESLSLASVSTHLLKVTVRRDRPDGSNELSFPSNHAAGSFSLATTLQLRHGWPAGVPAYLLASFVSFSRIQQNKHFASDTLFGAVLGSTVAHAVWKVHAPEPPSMVWLPVIHSHHWGLAGHLTF